ncbi:hypothetical protein ABL78_3759 [Leptomonas seymouri]|uniref:Uncharacterized protein n=1 Tax=Leptomonas seymouri TaxID=5684 RepID=A0A0N0P6H2_LEPSE|nr:hypothetical protein ABL78_3759 [Leptomonas seymouri]|eukprot:KPI87157.1 hypothetical protein ABL78_3759 [Leptomonas seymouri]
MGSSGSVDATSTRKGDAEGAKDCSALHAYEVHELKTPTTKKKHDAQKRKKESMDRAANCEQRRLPETPKPISTSAASPKKRNSSEATNYSYLPVDFSALQNEARAASAPPVQGPKAISTEARAGLLDEQFWDSLAPKSPAAHHGLQDTALVSCRQHIIQLNLSSNANLTEPHAEQKESVHRKGSENADAGGGRRQVENSDPSIPVQKRPVNVNGERSFSEYSYVCLMNAAHDFDDDLVSDSDTERRSLTGTTSSVGSSFRDAPTVLREPVETMDGHPFPAPTPLNSAPPVDGDMHSYGSNCLTRKGTFGLLMPICRSIVVQRGDMASFRCNGGRRLSRDPEAHDRPREDFAKQLQAVQCTGSKGETPLTPRTTTPRLPRGEIAPPGESKVPSENPSKPHAAPSPAPTWKAPTKADSPRSYPLPQPLMYGPRNNFSRSPFFDVERVLGFQVHRVRRIPSPDWRKMDAVEASQGSPRQVYPYNALPHRPPRAPCMMDFRFLY